MFLPYNKQTNGKHLINICKNIVVSYIVVNIFQIALKMFQIALNFYQIALNFSQIALEMDSSRRVNRPESTLK